MKQNIFKSTLLCLGLFLMAFTFCSFTGPNRPEQKQQPQDQIQTRGGGEYDYFTHVAADATYAVLPVPLIEGCTLSSWESYTIEDQEVRFQINPNTNEYPREFDIIFSSSCLGMDRIFRVAQDGTQYPYVNGDDKG